MSNPLIGLGNIPNVYITKINLYNNNTESYGVDTFLTLKDSMQSGKYVWSGDELFFNFLKVCFIETTSPQLAAAIKYGNLKPHPDELVRSTLYDDSTSITIVPLREFSKRSRSSSCSYIKKIESTISYGTDNVTVFALCYLDSESISKHLHIDLGGIMKKYYGPVTSEKIYENGALVDTTHMFLRPNKSIWVGPVHFQNNSYMEGPRHIAKPHGILKKVSVSNVKLTDDRTVYYPRRGEISIKNAPIISNLYYSINEKTVLSGIFSINMEQFALLKTKHGRKMFGTSQRMFMDFVNTLKISSFSIEKNQITTIVGTNAVGTPKVETKSLDSYKEIVYSSDTAPGSLKSTDTVQQIYLNENGLIRSYHFIDPTTMVTDTGEYRYTARVLIIDKSEDFISNLMERMEFSLNSLSDTVSYLNRKSSYDYEIEELYVNIETPDQIKEVVETYYNVLSYTQQITPEQERSLMFKKMTLFLAGNYRAIYGERFLNDFKQLYSRFMKNFQVAASHPTTTRQGVRSSFQPGLIEISKQFEDIFNFSFYLRSYNYLGKSDGSKTTSFSHDEYASRGDREISRFFDTTKAATPENFRDLDNNVSTAITNLDASKNSFLSPLEFIFNTETIDISSLSKLNAAGLAEAFLASTDLMQDKVPRYKASYTKSRSNVQMQPNSTENETSSTTPTNNNFAISIPNDVTKIFNLENQSPEKSSQYLGDDSNFVPAEEETKTSAPEVDIVQIKQAVNTATRYRTSRDKNDFDITARESILDSFLTSKKYDVETLKMSPLSFKALLCSRADGVRNNILASKGDILTDPSMKIATEMLFMTTQTVEMLVGYQKDINGLNIITEPIWELFRPEKAAKYPTLICRLRYTEKPEIGLTPSHQFMIPVQNSTFLVSSRDVFSSNIKSPEPIQLGKGFNMKTKNKLSKSIKYATSNVVIQPQDLSPVKNLEQFNMSPSKTAKSSVNAPMARGRSY